MNERSAARFWISFIVILLTGTAAAQGIMLYDATHDPTFSIVPDYYQKAVAWDTTMARDRANEALGWHAAVAIDADGTVHVALTDRGGLPLAGVALTGVARHNLDGDHLTPLAFADAGPGAFVAPLASARRGAWEVQVTAVRGDDRFVTSVRAERAR